jgi:two-component system OmpR family sensor kinase
VEVLAAPAAQVLGDTERLRQVLRNVIGNALRHTPPGTRIRLSLQVENGLARVVVDDDGPGIAPEHLPHVFDRFYRGDPARSRSAAGEAVGGSTGAGLGLAIAKHLVEAHDGTVGVESALGRGTRIQIDIPTASG